MIRVMLFVGILAAFAVPSVAQISVQEAQSRLAAKTHAREVAATQPTTLTNAEVEALQKQIRQQEGEIANLKQQLATLRQQLAKSAPPPPTTEDQARQQMQDFKAHVVGMKLAEAVEKMKSYRVVLPNDIAYLDESSGDLRHFRVNADAGSWGDYTFHFLVDKNDVIQSFYTTKIFVRHSAPAEAFH